jgi:alpha-amylase/alpha-mannosidase (GH57 family)
MKRRVCIHGHFYQPPRENPWLEEIEVQDSAFPYHDWNERITAECYGPNAASRILGDDKRIVDIVNNYAKTSFNFGPTLLSWLERHDPWVYRSVLEADAESRRSFGGHGSALAQAYNHMILPLANARDKRTQVIWGIADFRHRFGREPEGMWLPETAVDLETLDVLAGNGILFTILAPYQAKRVRPASGGEWEDVTGGRVDPRKPYLCRLPSGREITLFFYDGPIAHDVAFGGLLESGEALAGRLLEGFSGSESGPELVNIATDGETYGHHHRFGDMALAYALLGLEKNRQVRLTVYGEYLEEHPAADEAEIYENSSWSCSHGVERWRNDCGCSTGAHPGWHQKWRGPLRQAMDRLRDGLAAEFERAAASLLRDPWQARDDYISVILDRAAANVEAFFSRHASARLSAESKSQVLRLLEMQRHAQLMYTSCGWFFDDISGMEAVQVIQYAARAIQLAREAGGEDLEPVFVRMLAEAPGNTPELRDGALVYDKAVKPAVLDLLRVGVHYAISSLFESYPKTLTIGAYTVTNRAYDLSTAGRQRLLLGQAELRSEILWEEDKITFAVIHLGDHNIIGGARPYSGADPFVQMRTEIKEAFGRSDVPRAIDLMDKHFGTHHYSLWYLFRDEKRKAMNAILDSTLRDVEASFRQVHDIHYPMMQAMREMQIPIPKTLAVAAEFILNTDLRRLLEKDDLDLDRVQALDAEFRRWSLEMDKGLMAFVLEKKIDALLEALARNPDDATLFDAAEAVFRVKTLLGVEPNLWKSQNIYFAIRKKSGRRISLRKRSGDPRASRWLVLFSRLGDHLYIKPSR